MIDHGVEHEPRHGYIAKRCGGLGRCEHRTTIDDDDLLVNGDHPRRSVDAVERQAERLTLTEPHASTDEYEQRVPAWHHTGKHEHLTPREQAHYGGADFGQPDIGAWCLADVAVPGSSAHNAGKYDIDGFDSAGSKAPSM